MERYSDALNTIMEDKDDDPYGSIQFDSTLDDDIRVREHIESSTEDPHDFLCQTGKVLKEWAQKLIKV